jgi:hypothetical protein
VVLNNQIARQLPSSYGVFLQDIFVPKTKILFLEGRVLFYLNF